MSEEKKIIPEGQLTDEALDAATGGDGAAAGYETQLVYYDCTNPECGNRIPESLLIFKRWYCPYCGRPVDKSSAPKTVRTISFKPYGAPKV